MSHRLVILNLSDSHIGNPDHSLESIEVFKPLFKDIKAFSKENDIIPTIIVFSGDLVYGNIPENKIEKQFLEAKKFINSILDCFNSKENNDIPFIIAPGNHDVDRLQIDEGQKKSEIIICLKIM
jgi:3',5'-cyclic AMP phosphodiesterase CpdA